MSLLPTYNMPLAPKIANKDKGEVFNGRVSLKVGEVSHVAYYEGVYVVVPGTDKVKMSVGVVLQSAHSTIDGIRSRARSARTIIMARDGDLVDAEFWKTDTDKSISLSYGGLQTETERKQSSGKAYKNSIAGLSLKEVLGNLYTREEVVAVAKAVTRALGASAVRVKVQLSDDRAPKQRNGKSKKNRRKVSSVKLGSGICLPKRKITSQYISRIRRRVSPEVYGMVTVLA